MGMFSSSAPRHKARRHKAQFPWASAAVLVCLLTGCTRYPEVTSPESLLLISAARTACSSQNPERLERVRQRVEELRAESKLSQAEYEAFGRILDMAERGDWEAAEKACFHYQKAQLR